MAATTVKNFVKNTYGDAQPDFGGTLATIQGIVNFSDASAVNIGVLPAGATVTDWMIEELIDFDAATTNTMDLGVTGDGDYFANDVNIGTQGVQRKGVSGTDFTVAGTKFTVPKTITATYAQTGTAATQGQALVTFTYRVDNVS